MQDFYLLLSKSYGEPPQRKERSEVTGFELAWLNCVVQPDEKKGTTWLNCVVQPDEKKGAGVAELCCSAGRKERNDVAELCNVNTK